VYLFVDAVIKIQIIVEFYFFKVETRDQLAWFAGELNTGMAAHKEEKMK
jgi:hypothetical protein